jgi:carbamoyl-phosphate synthase large subunit
MGIKTFLPTKNQFALRNKAKLAKVVDSFGAITPETFVILSLAEFEEVIKKINYPLMIKGPYYRAYYVSTQAELTQRFYELTSEFGYPIILQKVVSGIELNLAGVGDGEGGHLGLVAIKKMQTTALGKIWSAMTIHNPDLSAMAESFLRATNWRGPFELECISDPAGKIYLIEINPRNRYVGLEWYSQCFWIQHPAAVYFFRKGTHQNHVYSK